MRNIRLVLAYDGTDFHGWQRQPDASTIQGRLEEALEALVGVPTPICGSGRTDAGVHALSQVANFHTASPIPCPNLVKALNDLLPPTIRVKRADEEPSDFHARYAAKRKTYRYRILQSAICSPFWWRFVWHYPYPLDYERMSQAARCFEGEHDFTSFAAADAAGENAGKAGGFSPSGVPQTSAVEVCGASLPQDNDAAQSNVRVVYESRLAFRTRTSLLVYQVTGNGFLHHMVRNIVGTLVEVGRGKLAPSDISRILAARDRTQAGPTAPAQGLCLVKVLYR
jgi:tRNA pseudouridine38-40 synthase